jgi:two-component system cell cycle response regulator PopA
LCAIAFAPRARNKASGNAMRIVLRCYDGRRARALREALDCAGLSVSALTGPAALRTAPGGEDLTLIDAQDIPAALALAQTLRDNGGPSLAIVGLRAQGPSADESMGLDAWASPSAPGECLRRRLDSAFRDGVMAAECVERGRTAEALGLGGPAPANSNRPPAALFVGAPATVFLPLETAFAKCGGQLRASFTSFSAFDHLHDDAFDALVLHGGADASAALSLISALRRNARLYDMPTLLFADDAETRDAGIARGADETAPADGDCNAVALWLAEDVRRARRRRALVRALECPVAEPDKAFGFFSFHLAGQAQTHHDRGRPLSIGVLEISGGENAGSETWARGFGEIAMLSARLVRAADISTPIDARRIAFAFPCMGGEGARVAMQRVIEVCECTAFAAGDGGCGPLSFAIRTAELSPGESGAGLLSRALQDKAA